MKSLLAVITLFSVVLCTAISAPALTAPFEISNAVQPQITVGDDGRVWLVYARITQPTAAPTPTPTHVHAHAPKQAGHQPQGRDADLFVTFSDDGGATFAPAVKIASVPKLLVGMRRGPRIASHGDRLTITVIADELRAFTSDDAGRTWSDPVTINAVATSAREGLHDLAVAPDGSLFVTWLDLRNGKMELWGARSRDGGRTWAQNEQVYRSPDVSICECCHPTALFDSAGNLAVMWRNSIDGSRDMWITMCARESGTFAPATKLGAGTWKLKGCPMDGGKIIALGEGRFASVWQRAGEVFYAPAGESERSLGQGKQPVAVARGEKIFVVWQQGADLVSTKVGAQSAPLKHGPNARFPVLASLAKSAGAVLAYERIGGGDGSQISVVVERL